MILIHTSVRIDRGRTEVWMFLFPGRRIVQPARLLPAFVSAPVLCASFRIALT